MRKLAVAFGVVAVIGTAAATIGVCYGQESGMMGRQTPRGGMMGGQGIGGDWHHVRMHGFPRDTSKMSFARRGQYIFETACVDCHGPGGRGGVKNPNYEQDTVPALNELADSMGVFTQEDADLVIAMLKQGVDPAKKRTNPPFRGYARFVAQYESVRQTIQKGREAAKKNPKGRQPQDMPAWGGTLSDRDVDAVIAYVIGLSDFPERKNDAEHDTSFP